MTRKGFSCFGNHHIFIPALLSKHYRQTIFTRNLALILTNFVLKIELIFDALKHIRTNSQSMQNFESKNWADSLIKQRASVYSQNQVRQRQLFFSQRPSPLSFFCLSMLELSPICRRKQIIFSYHKTATYAHKHKNIAPNFLLCVAPLDFTLPMKGWNKLKRLQPSQNVHYV